MNRVEAMAKIESIKSTMIRIRKELDFNIDLVYDVDMMDKIDYIKQLTEYDRGWNDGLWTISDILSGEYEDLSLSEFKEFIDENFDYVKHS